MVILDVLDETVEKSQRARKTREEENLGSREKPGSGEKPGMETDTPERLCLPSRSLGAWGLAEGG